MTLNEYAWNGSTYQFDPEDAPEDAELISGEPAVKAVTPKNKQRAPRATKQTKPVAAPSGIEDATDPDASE